MDPSRDPDAQPSGSIRPAVTRTRRKRPHPARQARRWAAAMSVVALLGLGGTIAVASSGGNAVANPTAATTASGTSPSTSSKSSATATTSGNAGASVTTSKGS
ncbi:MAG: hypothetical protein JWL73_967 [Actinomycetia bacterium]|nr:hypothetical protein [Actinomycetes bacterium]